MQCPARAQTKHKALPRRAPPSHGPAPAPALAAAADAAAADASSCARSDAIVDDASCLSRRIVDCSSAAPRNLLDAQNNSHWEGKRRELFTFIKEWDLQNRELCDMPMLGRT